MEDAKAEEFVKALKFVPIDIRLDLVGYGGEVVMGTITEEAYRYFTNNNVDIEEYSHDWDNDADVPESVQPFAPGQWHECDDLVHETGVEFSDSCYLKVYNAETEELLFETDLSYSSCEDSGIEVEAGDEYYASGLTTSPVYFGQSTEKGLFYSGTIKIREPFNPNKLKITTVDIEGWELVTNLAYADDDVESDDYDTRGKGFWAKFLNVDEE